MSVFAPANEILLRQDDGFKQSRILFSGDIQDDLPVHFVCAKNRVFTQFYHHWQALSCQMGKNARFSLVAEQSDVDDCNTLIYYWPKNKLEAQFQLMNLLSLLPKGCDIFVVGENNRGIRSAGKMLKNWATLRKIDSARRGALYHGRLKSQPTFNIEMFWHTYSLDELIIKTLPGVFGRDSPDAGSRLLLSTLMPCTKGKVLDFGCGSGVLAAVLASHSPKVQLTLCDVSASAIESSRATLTANGLEGKVFASNIFSNITDYFDLIISNPPFHDGIKTNLEVIKTLIRGSLHRLRNGGELRIVANSFLPYPKILDEIFGFHRVIAQTSRFKVYSTTITRCTKISSLRRLR